MSTHTFTQSSLPLEEPVPDGRTFLNASLWFVDSDGYRVIFHRHEPIYRVALADEVHLRLIAVTLRQSRLATQEEICLAFGHGVSTQVRWEQQYRKHGVDGLMPKKGSGRPREMNRSQEAFVRKWFRAGRSNRKIAERLGLAVPLLAGHGLIEAFVKVYGSLHPSFYDLRSLPGSRRKAARRENAKTKAG